MLEGKFPDIDYNTAVKWQIGYFIKKRITMYVETDKGFIPAKVHIGWKNSDSNYFHFNKLFQKRLTNIIKERVTSLNVRLDEDIISIEVDPKKRRLRGVEVKPMNELQKYPQDPRPDQVPNVSGYEELEGSADR